MVHLIYFYSNTVLCGLDIIGYIEFEAAEHAYYIFFFPFFKRTSYTAFEANDQEFVGHARRADPLQLRS